MRTGTRSRQRAGESRLLASATDGALAGTFVAGLRNTLLVQLHRHTFGGGAPVSSLYAVYREAGMTFDAIARLAIPDDSQPLADVLQQFIRGTEFDAAVLRPLRAKVRGHFKR